MGHALAPRSVAALAAVLVAASFAFAWIVSRERPASRPPRAESVDGARAFRLRCLHCHALEDLAEPLRASPDPRTAAVELLDHLSGHGGAGPEENAAIVEHLLRSAEEMGRR
jgi:hypothetical protein